MIGAPDPGKRLTDRDPIPKVHAHLKHAVAGGKMKATILAGVDAYGRGDVGHAGCDTRVSEEVFGPSPRNPG